MKYLGFIVIVIVINNNNNTLLLNFSLNKEDKTLSILLDNHFWVYYYLYY